MNVLEKTATFIFRVDVFSSTLKMIGNYLPHCMGSHPGTQEFSITTVRDSNLTDK